MRDTQEIALTEEHAAVASTAADAVSPVEPATAGGGDLPAIAAPRFAIPMLLALGWVLFLSNLGGYPLYTKGEPREAVTVFDIVHGGGVILPMRAGVEIPSKPLLMHWIAAALSFADGGVTEFTVRLPSALLAIAGMLICYLYVRKLFDQVSAIVAAILLGTTFQYLQAGTGARVDMTLTFFLELAFFEFLAIAEGLTPRRMLLYVAISFAILAKGPVGLVLPAAVALVWIVIERRWYLIGDLRPVRGAAVVAILGGGWYFAAAYVGGMDFVRKQILSENLMRFIGGPAFHEGHAHPFYYVELALLGGFLPWTILFPVPLLQSFGRKGRFGPRLTYLFIWSVVVLVFYSVAQSKRGVYLLALYPALATILALYLVDAFMNPTRATVRLTSIVSTLAGIAMLLVGIAALIGLAVVTIAPLTMRDFLSFWGISAPGFVPALSSAINDRWALAAITPIVVEILGFVALRRASLQRVIGVVAAATACGALAANFIVVPAVANTLSLHDFALEMVNTAGSDSVGYLGALDYDVAFYSGRNIPIVQLHDPDLPDYLICWKTIYERLPDSDKNRFVVALTSNPTGLDGSGELVLLRRATHPPSPNSNATEVRNGRDEKVKG